MSCFLRELFCNKKALFVGRFSTQLVLLFLFCLGTMMSMHSLEENDAFLCPKCDTVFSYDEHSFESHPCQLPGNKVQCNYCLWLFPSKNALESHKQKHVLQKDRFECKVCRRTFKHATNRHRHLKSHFRHMKTHACEICGQTFVRKDTCKAHFERCRRGSLPPQPPSQIILELD